MMTRRELLTVGAGAPAGRAALAQPPRRPNIVLILADDLGYGDLGCYGQKQIETPNLDRMAAEGMRFTSAYAGSTVCAPSRCALMTGLHTGHAHSRGNASPDLPLRPLDTTVAELLKSAGYRTALVGKWSLGELGSTGYPTRKGFDEWFGYFSQLHAHNYYPEHLLDNETAHYCHGNSGRRKGDYAPDLFTRRALAFIDRQRSGIPFFLHVCYTTPHANNEMGRDTGNGMEVPSDAPYSSRSWSPTEKNFAAMITRMDRDVGSILQAIECKGLNRDTFILFTSDNGPHREGGHDPEFFRSSGPFRGIKRDLYEGGIRVPAIARWPGIVPSGVVSNYAWAFWDFLPTAAELAGLAVPSSLDGLSFVPALMGKAQAEHEHFYWEFHEGGFAQAARAGRWKAIRRQPDRPLEIYDLETDPSERRDLAATAPDIVTRMDGILRSARIDSPEFPIARAGVRGRTQ